MLELLLELCVSSLRRGHANLLCIVPILTYARRRRLRKITGYILYDGICATHKYCNTALPTTQTTTTEQDTTHSDAIQRDTVQCKGMQCGTMQSLRQTRHHAMIKNRYVAIQSGTWHNIALISRRTVELNQATSHHTMMAHHITSHLSSAQL